MRSGAHGGSGAHQGDAHKHERVALVKLPELPLQILLRERPEFRGRPTAVLAAEGSDARITHLNRAALAAGLRVGLTQSSARDRLPNLHTGVVAPERVQALEAEIASGLQMLTPKVEPCAHFPSTFFLDPNGMEKLYGGLDAWTRSTHAFLKGRGLFACTWVGFHRYRLYAAAGMQLTERVLKDPTEEQLLANGADLRMLGLPAQLCDDLAMLEVHALGDLLALPAAEFGGRFGPQAAKVRGLFAEDAQLPLQPLGFEEPTEARFDINPPDADTHRLLFAIKAALHPLLLGLRERGEHIRALHLGFELDAPQGKQRIHRDTVEPASPSGDLMTLVELVRLRLAQTELPFAVETVTLRAETERAQSQPIALPGMRPKRDPDAAARALARIRAAYGPRSVVRARLREAHLPEARFAWVPTLEPPRPAFRSLVTTRGQVPEPSPASAPASVHDSVQDMESVLVRRVLRRPLPLRTRAGARRLAHLRRSDPPRTLEPGQLATPALVTEEGVTEEGPGTLPEGPAGEEVQRMYGPYRVSGGWWKRTVERDYYYAETDTGGLLWVYWDRPRGAWFLHGTVD